VTRADRVARLVGERDLDAMLVTGLVNVRYLTGYTGTNGLCAVGPDLRLFLTDFRYVEQAAEQVRGYELARGRQDLLPEAAERLSGRIGFEDHHLTVRQYERLRGLIPAGSELVPAGGLVEELRAVKDEEELAAIRAAAELADEVLESVLERGLVGRSELEVARDVDRGIRERGGEPSFPPIVAAGPHGALPHAEPRDVAIGERTLVIVDWGARVDGYCSDCTRTFATGDPGGEAEAVYELVLEAQQRALEAVTAGAGCRDVDGVARDAIAAAGHGERFGHGLGHGVGLEVHEGPRLAQTADCELAAGNVVTVEPGVYLSGAFGVRIEDLVTVTDTGCDVLSRFPKSLVTLGA
jgi:Xaa-Pro aminopeptidase